MKTSQKSLFVVLAVAASLTGSATSFGQTPPAAAPGAPAAGAPAAGARGGGGGGGRGGAAAGTFGVALPMPEGGLHTQSIRPPALNDLELTAITRFDLLMAKQAKDLRDARTALTAASVAQPTNKADIEAKVQALAKAELDLALARAENFGKLKAEIGQMTPEKQRAVIQQAGRGN